MPNNLTQEQFEHLLESFRNNYEDLVNAIESRKVIFFVGAGISCGSPTNIETAKDLSQRLKEKFSHYNWWRDYFDRNRLAPELQRKRLYNDSSDIPKLNEIAELFLSRNEFERFIEEIMEDQRWQTINPNICHSVLSELLIEEICSGIITPNLDDRIETRHREITKPGVGPNIISHNEFRINQRHTNNIFKIHGCLFFSPEKRNQTIWATSHFEAENWPSEYSFAHDVILRFGQDGLIIVFVAFSTHLKYLGNTINEIIDSGGDYNQFYCINKQSYDELTSDTEGQEFAASIGLEQERHCEMDAEIFFRIIRQLVFNKLFIDLCQRNMYLKGDEFDGGSLGYSRIPQTVFREKKNLLKNEVLKLEREFFQRFLQLVLLEKDIQNRYVFFRYIEDRIAKLFFWLILFRFNFNLIFCKTRYRHLILKKNNFKASLIILYGYSRKPLQIILHDLNKDMENDHEMREHLKNVFVFGAPIDSIDSVTNLVPSGTGRITDIERPSGLITNASAFNYNILHEDQLRKFISESSSVEEFQQMLDDFSWRI